jgi:hypothetical protein
LEACVEFSRIPEVKFSSTVDMNIWVSVRSGHKAREPCKQVLVFGPGHDDDVQKSDLRNPPKVSCSASATVNLTPSSSTMTAVHVIQRPLRGSRISTFYPIKSLPSLSSLDSAFQLQEYISLLIRLDVHDVDSIVSLPGTSKKDGEVARENELSEISKEEDKESERKNDVQVDQACWIYEQLR